MPRFDSLQRASFNGIKFPVEEIEIRGGLRDHVHEYPHNPGGTPEKLGRKLYEVELVGLFHDTFAKYPNLYPDGLNALQSHFDDELTADLIVPTVGTIKAYAFQWRRRATGRQRSGERVTLVFREDQPADGLDAFVATATGPGGWDGLCQNLALKLDDLPSTDSLFDSITNAMNALLSVKDTADRYGGLLAAKLDALVSLCAQVDQLAVMKDPTNWSTASALRDVWAAAKSAQDDLSNKRSSIRHFITPTVMPIGEVARAIYGDGSRQIELLQLNPIDDAFAIPRGTDIRYYAAA